MRHRLMRPWILGFLLASRAGAPAVAGAEPTPPFPQPVRELLQEYCVDCHDADHPKGDLDLGRFLRGSDMRLEPRVWQAVAEQLAAGEMPPRDKPQPSATGRALILGWVEDLLDRLALAQSGDPGPVLLRRLSNAEYTHTLRDLTGVPSLDPAREFPVDGAAGEGFVNTGNALTMSPALLTKYLDAAREVAAHMVLLPDGIRFSEFTTRRDRSQEIIDRIREFYRRHTAPGGGSRVNLQGIVLETNAGGRLPIEQYLSALLAERATGTPLPADLSQGYLALLRAALTDNSPSPLLGPLRERWRTATAGDIPDLVAHIAAWQQSLWRFQSVGHIGKVGGPRAWQEPVTPLATRQELRLPMPPPDAEGAVTFHLWVGDAGDGPTGDLVRWENPRFVAAGRPDLPLRGIRTEVAGRRARIRQLVEAAPAALAAAAEAIHGDPDREPGPAELASRHGITGSDLLPWLRLLGLSGQPPPLRDLFTRRLENLAGHSFVNGWGDPQTPSAVANGSDREVRIPGRLPGRRLALHPSPTRDAVVAWRSPVADAMRITAGVRHAHPECGNGVTWRLEIRSGNGRRTLAAGVAHGDNPVEAGPFDRLQVREGDVVAIVIGPRDGNHSCDLTVVDLEIAPASPGLPVWRLADDLSGDILAGNPHADSRGTPGVWHLLSEATAETSRIAWAWPAGSILDRWMSAEEDGARRRLAAELHALLTGPAPISQESPDAQLRHQLTRLDSPLLAGDEASSPPDVSPDTGWGLDRGLFGRLPDGTAIPGDDLAMQGPGYLTVRVPAELVAGTEFRVTGRLDETADSEGSVQLEVTDRRPQVGPGVHPGSLARTKTEGRWTDSPGPPVVTMPVLAAGDSAARSRFEREFQRFRDLFPAALCYERIVPVDEVVTLTLHYREDDHLRRLMLTPSEAEELDRLWEELHYVSQDALALVDAFEQLWQFATQDADPSAFEPLREPIRRRAEAFRDRLRESEPRHVEAVVGFADLAWRRPLSPEEQDRLRTFYHRLRGEELPHEEALRFTLVRILTAPGFLYHLEQPGPGPESVPVSDWELAARLSYFLWSGPPDGRLRQLAASGRLREPDILASEARRMLTDPRVRRLATEFGCAWLQIHGFDTLDEKSDRHFPTFAGVRGDLYEEAILFLSDLFRSDLPVSSLLEADHTHLNGRLAGHYGIAGIEGPEWRRVDGMRSLGHGGVLGLGAVLAKQSGASRTSPILRGNWLCEVLLGERLPRPPAGVPVLPEDEAETEGMTVRELVERHSRDPKCAGCHVRIDPYGFALEAFDAIGRRRERDLAGRAIDTRVRTLSGAEFEGLDGLRKHLATSRMPAFANQFCRKLLGYALGRSVLISDRPLLHTLRDQALSDESGVADIVETIARSRQFREIRGRDFAPDP